MPVKSTRVNLSVPPNRVKKLIDVGRQNRFHGTDGSLKVTTICIKIINFFVDLYNDPDVQVYLNKNGGTLLDLILRAVKKTIESD